MDTCSIRAERPGDASRIRRVHLQAFETAVEADIVDTLRTACPEGLSLVAEVGGEVVGHILFTPAVIDTGARQLRGVGLAPVAVLPAYQGRGIGSCLVRAGIERVRAAGHPFVIVLGHPGYYPRFGFERASRYGIACEYAGVPDEAFMLLALDPESFENVSGVARYRPEFRSAV